MEALASASQQQVREFESSACPLCLKWEENLWTDGKTRITSAQFRRHLGRHMEQLALSVVWRAGYNQDETIVSDESGDDAESVHEEVGEDPEELEGGTSEVDMGNLRSLEAAMSIHFALVEERARHFSDRDIEFIRELLAKANKISWSARPRTYAVLRMISLEELMDKFVEEGLYDIKLPYTSLTLPLIVKSPTSRRKFLEKQALVLTEARGMESGSHVHLSELY